MLKLGAQNSIFDHRMGSFYLGVNFIGLSYRSLLIIYVGCTISDNGLFSFQVNNCLSAFSMVKLKTLRFFFDFFFFNV